MASTRDAPHGWVAVILGVLLAAAGFLSLYQGSGVVTPSAGVLLTLGTILVVAGIVVLAIADVARR